MFHYRHQLDGVVSLPSDVGQDVLAEMRVGSDLGFVRADAHMALVDAQTLDVVQSAGTWVFPLEFGRIPENALELGANSGELLDIVDPGWNTGDMFVLLRHHGNLDLGAVWNGARAVWVVCYSYRPHAIFATRH
eukprot:Lithocolla_globosa_v1_NODE_2332_length_2045_cov_3.522613.p2 type:complete len:134 gc:universal NODE_2332_length_2045_cov_3.522613:1322-1723(+)